VEFTWATFLVRGMEQGVLAEADPRLLTRALLGLYNSVWHWYRPRGSNSLQEVSEFFIRRQLAVLGLPPELADADRSQRPPTARKPRATPAGKARSASAGKAPAGKARPASSAARKTRRSAT
jgi:hypothetical protein